MKKLVYTALASSVLFFGSCESFLDVNDDPNNITSVEVTQLLPSVTVNIGYTGAADLYKYTALLMQQLSGHGPNTGFGTFKEYERYNINDSDVNGQWVRLFGTMLSDTQLIIDRADETGNAHYAGVARILKAYLYQIIVDTWGDVPYFNASQHNGNLYPEVDDDEAIYADLILLIDQGIADLNATSALSPNNHSTIYRSSSWATSKAKWERFANTLKLRIYLHYSAKDPSFSNQKITELVNSGAQFMQSNDDSFEMTFLGESQRQSPLYSLENGQFRNQIFPNRFIVDLMNSKNDPRRQAYFVPFPYTSNPATATYKGASYLDDVPSRSYSRMHTFVYGTAGAVNPGLIAPDGSLMDGAISYDGAGTARLLPFAEYNFIRAEAALRGAPGDANQFFQAGIRASMEDAGISSGEINTYIAANGTLTGSTEQQVEQIINEKFVAGFTTMVEPWTDYRRTGYPALTPHKKPSADYDEVPRSLLYSQSEVNNNPNVSQKSSMLERVFWDTRP